MAALDLNAEESNRLAAELRVAEYESVREEWLASRDAQQHTLRWTLAAIAVLLAGVLGSDARNQQPFLYVAIAGAVTGVAIATQTIWFGELMRMERASLFLRGLEVAVRDLDRSWPPPLIWDSWRASRGHRPVIASAAPLLIACFAIYALLATAGLTILCAAAADSQIPDPDRELALALALVLGAAYVGSTLYLLRQARLIWRSFDKPAQFDHLRPRSGIEREDGRGEGSPRFDSAP
jgi:hypothetical protein